MDRNDPIPLRQGPHPIVLPAVFLLLLLALGARTAAADMRCEGRLISVGDPKAKLLAHCGEPDAQSVVGVIRLEDKERRLDAYVDVWTYPSDGTEGFRTLHFEGGRLVGEGMRCGAHLVRAGDPDHLVRERCGEPLSRDGAGYVSSPAAPGPDASVRPETETLVVQWIYSSEEGRFMRIVTLEGGRITRIEDGPRP